MITEADTCRKYVLPKLIAAGWKATPHSSTEQKTFTDGCTLLIGGQVHRGFQKRADYLLRFTRDFAITIVEAKTAYRSARASLQARVNALKPFQARFTLTRCCCVGSSVSGKP